MPRFGKKSAYNLDQCDPRLQDLFETVVKDFDCTILTGHRTEKEQEKMVAEKKSKVHWPHGKHNALPSRAVDACPWPIPDWNDPRPFYYFGGYVMGVAQQMGIPLRYGGDWDGDRDVTDQTFNDLIHFEVVGEQ